MIRYELHLPVSDREAKKRDLPPKCAMLAVQPTDDENVIGELSNFIHIALSNSGRLLAQSISTFTGHKRLRQLLDEKGLRFQFDNEVNRRIRRPHDVVVDCHTPIDIANVMAGVSAEALVFYVLRPDSESETLEAIVEAGRDGYIESRFLGSTHAVPLFIFYSSTHPSIEILGELEPVRRLFFTYCEHGFT